MFPGYDEFMAEKAAESAIAYEVRWLKKLYDVLRQKDAFASDRKEAGDEFGFLWYNDNHSLPVKLHASRLKNIAPMELVRAQGITRRAFWREYFDYKANYARGEAVALIFPITATKHHVMHNMMGLEEIPGEWRHTFGAASPDRRITVESVEAFFQALAKLVSSDK